MQKIKGFFAWTLMNIDLLSTLPQQLLVERLGFAFIENIEYERLSPFCSF